MKKALIVLGLVFLFAVTSCSKSVDDPKQYRIERNQVTGMYRVIEQDWLDSDIWIPLEKFESLKAAESFINQLNESDRVKHSWRAIPQSVKTR